MHHDNLVQQIKPTYSPQLYFALEGLSPAEFMLRMHQGFQTGSPSSHTHLDCTVSYPRRKTGLLHVRTRGDQHKAQEENGSSVA